MNERNDIGIKRYKKNNEIEEVSKMIKYTIATRRVRKRKKEFKFLFQIKDRVSSRCACVCNNKCIT